jgi:hypothetical protein
MKGKRMKISEKLNKVDDNFSIYRYDNGFMLEITGKKSDDEWARAKIMAENLLDLLELVKEAATMERDE